LILNLLGEVISVRSAGCPDEQWQLVAPVRNGFAPPEANSLLMVGHVRLEVADEKLAKRFFVEGLGARPRDDCGEACMLAGATEIVLSVTPDRHPTAWPGQFYVWVEDIQASRAAFAALHRDCGHVFVLPVGALLDAAEGGSLNISDVYSSMTLGAVASRSEDGARKLEIFLGQAGSVAATGEKVSDTVKASFNTMRFIVTVGWSIYPLGYFFGYLLGSVNDDSLNLVYNLADFVNKIAFCLAIWASAKTDTRERMSSGSH